MTGIVARGVDEAALSQIWGLTAILAALYLLRVLFRFMSNCTGDMVVTTIVAKQTGEINMEEYRK